MNKRILIADDNLSIVKLLSLRLKANKYDVFQANDGMECIDMALKKIPDLILMDIKMPNGDGIGTFEKLRQLKKTKNIPVIFITAYSKPVVNSQLLKFGAKACITKPFDVPEFINTIERTLEN